MIPNHFMLDRSNTKWSGTIFVLGVVYLSLLIVYMLYFFNWMNGIFESMFVSLKKKYLILQNLSQHTYIL